MHAKGRAKVIMAQPTTDDPYDEGTELDQEQTVKDGGDTKEKTGESFLAPKSAFPDDIEVGSTHTVTVEAIHQDEVQLVCSPDEPEAEPQPQQQTSTDDQGLYE